MKSGNKFMFLKYNNKKGKINSKKTKLKLQNPYKHWLFRGSISVFSESKLQMKIFEIPNSFLFIRVNMKKLKRLRFICNTRL